MKVLKHVLIFTCILPDYVAQDITKDFWKNIHFENTTAGFLLRCQNSLRYDISLICHWNIDSLKQDWSFVHVMVPKNDENVSPIQYRLHLVRTITVTGALLVKIYFCHLLKCIISGVVCRSEFWHLRRKPAVIVPKWLFFQNYLVISWATGSGKMQIKIKYFFWTFHSLKVAIYLSHIFCAWVYSIRPDPPNKVSFGIWDLLCCYEFPLSLSMLLKTFEIKHSCIEFWYVP